MIRKKSQGIQALLHSIKYIFMRLQIMLLYLTDTVGAK